MHRKRPNEPIAPATIPGEPLDPKIPPEQQSDDDEHDADDDVGTDERGKEMLRGPDVTSDRLLADADAEDGLARAKKPPLTIGEIENLEDDAKGG